MTNEASIYPSIEEPPQYESVTSTPSAPSLAPAQNPDIHQKQAAYAPGNQPIQVQPQPTSTDNLLTRSQSTGLASDSFFLKTNCPFLKPDFNCLYSRADVLS